MGIYKLYVEGSLGLHKGKPVLRATLSTKESAEKIMWKYLKKGHCAFVVSPEEEKDKDNER